MSKPNFVFNCIGFSTILLSIHFFIWRDLFDALCAWVFFVDCSLCDIFDDGAVENGVERDRQQQQPKRKVRIIYKLYESTSKMKKASQNPKIFFKIKKKIFLNSIISLLSLIPNSQRERIN